MKRIAIVCGLLALLVGCGTLLTRPPQVELPACAQEHTPPEQSASLSHEPVGYCGNTWTTVTCVDPGREEWSAGFMGGTSVALTDFLRWLDYSGPICRCLPEYRVDTEFGMGYGINLTDGYVRYGQGQAALTGEQVEWLRELLDPEKLAMPLID